MRVIFFGKENTQESTEIFFDEAEDFYEQLSDLINSLKEGNYLTLDARQLSHRQIEEINKAYGFLLRESQKGEGVVSCGELTLLVDSSFFELRDEIARIYCRALLTIAKTSQIQRLQLLAMEAEPILAWFIPACFCFVQAEYEDEIKDGSSFVNYIEDEDFDILERRFSDSEEKRQEIIFQRWVKLFDEWVKKHKQSEMEEYFKLIGVEV